MASDRLEDGRHAQTPTGDNLVQAYVRNDAEWMLSTAERAGNATLRTEDLVAIDAGVSYLFFNQVLLLQPVAAGRAEEVAAAIVGFFGSRDGSAFSTFSPWPVPPLPGITVDGYPPLMLRPAGGAAPAPPPELVIRPVESSDDLAAYEQVVVDGFGLESQGPHRRGSALDATATAVDGVRCFLGTVEGRAVSGAMSIASHGVNHVELVATLPDARGHGYGEALTWAATMAAPEVPAMLVASDMGRPVYERMGYLTLYRWTFLVGQR
jgi:GNAT superfamily N-acetyltransferase